MRCRATDTLAQRASAMTGVEAAAHARRLQEQIMALTAKLQAATHAHGDVVPAADLAALQAQLTECQTSLTAEAKRTASLVAVRCHGRARSQGCRVGLTRHVRAGGDRRQDACGRGPACCCRGAGSAGRLAQADGVT
jgi:hypothetical protein